MVTESPLDPSPSKGPTGFLECGTATLLVDYGRIYLDGLVIGHLFEDGYLKDTRGPLGDCDQFRPIDELTGCFFRGIDAAGLELNLPGAVGGPSGDFTYNGIRLNVINGRLATLDHRLVGTFDDNGIIILRDVSTNAPRQLDQNTQLNTLFQGKKSNGSPWKYEFTRPLFRRDRSYAENEIIHYFSGFDSLTTVQKKYVIDTMPVWASSGLLQIVRKSEGDASLGNVKHGAAGVTGVRTGNATFDKEEFDKDVELYYKYGPLFVAAKGPNALEVRLSLVVPHEFGHQLEFTLTQANQDKLSEIYKQRYASCQRTHSQASQSSGYSELLMTHEVEKRHFISGYAKTSMHEYWAEAVAAFSVKSTRQILKQLDPAVYQFLEDIVLRPTTMLRIVLHENILALQASLQLGGELADDILEK